MAAREEGWGIDKDSLRIQDETIEIAITETQDLVPHIPTPYELREKARYSWTRIPEKDYFPSGLLKLAITNADYLGIWVNWADGKIVSGDHSAQIHEGLGDENCTRKGRKAT